MWPGAARAARAACRSENGRVIFYLTGPGQCVKLVHGQEQQGRCLTRSSCSKIAPSVGFLRLHGVFHPPQPLAWPLACTGTGGWGRADRCGSNPHLTPMRAPRPRPTAPPLPAWPVYCPPVRRGATYGTLKITELYLSRQDVSYGVSLCLLLDSPCASLSVRA